MVTHRRRDTAEQRRHFRTRLGETEDVVDEEQHVLAFLVAEVFRHREAGQRDTGAGSRRLVHLAVDQCRFRFRTFLEIDNPGFDHLVIEIVSFAGPLADAGENRVAAVRFRDVVDQLHDQHGLADTRTAEEANLTALGVRCEKVDNLNTGDQLFCFRRLIDVLRGRTVDRQGLCVTDRAAFVDRLADDVDDPAQRFRTDRHFDRVSGIGHFRAADEAFGRIHRDAADRVFAQMLCHFEDEHTAVLLHMQCI